MAYFKDRKPIFFRTEARFKGGLAAALLQPYGKASRPIHFISRTLNDPEKLYSQTETDAPTIKWVKERFGMHLSTMYLAHQDSQSSRDTNR